MIDNKLDEINIQIDMIKKKINTQVKTKQKNKVKSKNKQMQSC